MIRGTENVVRFIRPESMVTPVPPLLDFSRSGASTHDASSRMANRSLRFRSMSAERPGRVAAERRDVVFADPVSVLMTTVRSANRPNTNGPIPPPTLQFCPKAGRAIALRMRMKGTTLSITAVRFATATPASEKIACAEALAGNQINGVFSVIVARERTALANSSAVKPHDYSTWLTSCS